MFVGQDRALLLMNECIFMFAQTYMHVCEHIQSFNIFAVKALFLIVKKIIPCAGFFL